MKHIYLFNEISHGTVYGIGAYIRQLALCLKDEEGMTFSIVHLHDNHEKEFKTEKTPEGYTIYYFPCVQDETLTYNDRYYRNIWFILSSHLKLKNREDGLYFHLNSSAQYPLIKLLKKKHPFSRILYTIHFQGWSFKDNMSCSGKNIDRKKKRLTDKEKKSMTLLYENEKKIYNEVDRIICLSKYTKKMLLADYHVPGDKISLIYNGLKDEAIFLSKEDKVKIKKRLFFPEQSRLILFAGRLVKMKGIDILIDAFKLLLKDLPDFHLIIAGDGDFSTYLEKCKGFRHKITFTGRLDKDELYRYYQLADVGVMPSIHEQCSYVAIEMMMFGLPVVTSNAPGLSEMLTGENSRYKVEAKKQDDEIYISAVSLKNKIMKALSDKGYGKRLREQYENAYDLKIMKKNYINTILKSAGTNG
jgi:glycosyltransferase